MYVELDSSKFNKSRFFAFIFDFNILVLRDLNRFIVIKFVVKARFELAIIWGLSLCLH